MSNRGSGGRDALVALGLLAVGSFVWASVIERNAFTLRRVTAPVLEPGPRSGKRLPEDGRPFGRSGDRAEASCGSAAPDQKPGLPILNKRKLTKSPESKATPVRAALFILRETPPLRLVLGANRVARHITEVAHDLGMKSVIFLLPGLSEPRPLIKLTCPPNLIQP